MNGKRLPSLHLVFDISILNAFGLFLIFVLQLLRTGEYRYFRSEHHWHDSASCGGLYRVGRIRTMVLRDRRIRQGHVRNFLIIGRQDEAAK